MATARNETVRADVAVPGGATAGAVVAGRLIENSSCSVVVEAGPDYGSFGSGNWPDDLPDGATLPISHDWGYQGSGQLTELMAPGSGYVLEAVGHRLCIAGDTVWCDEVGETLERHLPTVVVVNAGEARMLEGDPITMDAADVIAVTRQTAGVSSLCTWRRSTTVC